MTYTITEAANRCGLTAHTMRFYDKQGLLPFVQRSESGIRIFRESDLEWMKTINCLKDTGLSIKQIKEFIDWCMEGDSTIGKRLEFFREHKRAVELQMEELERHMETIEHKLEYYEAAQKAGTTAIHNKKKAETA